MTRIVLIVSIYFSFIDVFAQWNTNTSVNLEVAGLPVADMESLTTADGKTWIAFYHENTGNYDMRVQLLDINGQKLLGADGMLLDNQPSGSATFVYNICADASDNLIVTYQDERNGTMQTVAYKISPSGTHLWGTNGVVLGAGLAPYPVALSNGETVVSWNDGNTNTLSLQKISIAGNMVWPTPKTVKIGTSNTTRGQLVANLNGSFTLIMQRRGFGINTTLYAQRYDQDGVAVWPAAVQLNPNATSGARYYSVAGEADTTYCGFYSSAGMRFNSYVQRINPDGTLPYGSSGALFATATGSGDPYQQKTMMATTPGSPYVWSVCSVSDPNQIQYGVFIQKFLKSNGTRLLGDNALNVYPISANYETQFGKLSLVNDGPLFLSGDNSNKLYATRLDENGNFVWPGNRIEMASTGNSKSRVGFTGLADGQGVAIWTETRTSNLAYAQRITPAGLLAIDVSTQAGLPATINTPSGTLPLQAIISPVTASQNVNWSIIPVSGDASISASGVVTGIANGTVWAKAVSTSDNNLKDSLLITLSNQGIVAVTGIDVTTQGGVPATITVQNGTLPMVATIIPANATNQNVIWSVVPVTGSANIDANGLLTAVSNGDVWAKAVSAADNTIKDSLLVNINQFFPVTGLDVVILSGAPPVITVNAGSLQAVAVITPSNATEQAVNWSIVPVTGSASINASGLVTAIGNGTVWAKAVSVSNSLIKDSVLITITNQFKVDGSFGVFPNPTSNILILLANEMHPAMVLTITDAIGRKIKTISVGADALLSPFSIDVHDLPAGMYLIHSNLEDKFQRIKWVKQ